MAGIVGGDSDALMALDEKRRVAHEAHPDLVGLEGGGLQGGVNAAWWRRGLVSAIARQRLVSASTDLAAPNRLATWRWHDGKGTDNHDPSRRLTPPA
jgi:hypothetical protein